MRASVALILAVGAVAVAVGANVSLLPRNASPPVDDALDAVGEAAAVRTPDTGDTELLDSVYDLLDREVDARLRLEEEVAALRAEVESLRARVRGEADSAPAETSPPSSNTLRRVPRPEQREGGDVTQGSFLSAGFSDTEAAYYKELTDQNTMARLYLRDQATREGWYRSDRYFQALEELPGNLSTMRENMDDETYARYLYALGRPNQVRVTRVISGSAAETAGLQAGDVIRSYDTERLFSNRALRTATRAGEAGELVPVEVVRNDQTMQVYIPRGPLGISMTSESAQP